MKFQTKGATCVVAGPGFVLWKTRMDIIYSGWQYLTAFYEKIIPT
jgi:hypothetical protein